MGRSVMFSRFKPAMTEWVVRAGYNAGMRGKQLKYHGLVTHSISLLTRLLPRSVTCKLAICGKKENSTSKKILFYAHAVSDAVDFLPSCFALNPAEADLIIERGENNGEYSDSYIALWTGMCFSLSAFWRKEL